MNTIPVICKGLLENEKFWVDPENLAWLAWLDRHKSFRYEPLTEDKGFTVRREREKYWYAYRKVSGKLHKTYIGKTDELSVKLLEEAAIKLKNPTPRKEKVEDKVTQYATIEEITKLRGELQALRQEMQSLVKLKAR